MKKAIAIVMVLLMAVAALTDTVTFIDRAAAGAIKTGIVKKGKNYYLYDSEGKIITKNKTLKGVKYYISADKKHTIRARRYKGKYYYANGRIMTKADSHDFQTLLRAEKIAGKITKKSWSKMKKLEACFKWVIKLPYVSRRTFTRVKDWPALHADDHFIRKGGDCHADGAAFAYLAAACGYTKVYAVLDSGTSPQSHGWAEVNGKAFDPLFAQAKNYSRNWNAPYSVYELDPAVKVRIPYGKPSHNKKGKMIPVKTTGLEKKKIKGKRKIEKWDSKTRHLLYNDGSFVTGTVVWKEKFYSFTAKGAYREAYTKNLRKAAVQGKDIAELQALTGEPLSKEYSASCNGDGDDGIWKYSGFTVYTFRPREGTEIFWGAE